MIINLQIVKFGRFISAYPILILTIIMMMSLSFSVLASDIKIRALTSSFPPLQIFKNEQADGYTVNVIKSVVEKINQKDQETITVDFEFLPWKRALRIATSNRPNILFFSLSRSPEREDQFHWIGHISRYDMHLFSLDEKLLHNEQSLEAIQASQRVIGVQDGSNVEEYLLSLKFIKDIDYITFSDYREGIRMLYRHRVDYIPMTSFLARGNVCVENLEPNLLIKGIRLNQVSKPLWVVFSKSTSAKLIQRFSNALNVFNGNDEHKVNIQLQTNRWTDQVCDKEKL
jgi:polar amino acid transport system substrate-binding protein